MKVRMKWVRGSWGRHAERKVRAGHNGRPKATKLRNQKRYKQYLDSFIE